MSLKSPLSLIATEYLNTDPIWHVQLTVVLAIILQLGLPDRYAAGPRFILPILEVLLIVALYITSQKLLATSVLIRKFNSITLITLMAAANIYALHKLAYQLLAGGKVDDGRGLILAAVNIFLTNIIVFALLYWETDAGGPIRRRVTDVRNRDFSFPQMQNPELAPTNWEPNFIDYLYVAATNATAFSPTDTLPLSRRAKLLMLVQALISLTTLALVASRAVNILK